jgi:hypothetical protein
MFFHEHGPHHRGLALANMLMVIEVIIQWVVSIAAAPCRCTTQSPASNASRGARQLINSLPRLVRGSTRSSRTRSRVLCAGVPQKAPARLQ